MDESFTPKHERNHQHDNNVMLAPSLTLFYMTPEEAQANKYWSGHIKHTPTPHPISHTPKDACAHTLWIEWATPMWLRPLLVNLSWSHTYAH